jgi:hypothetical protein
VQRSTGDVLHAFHQLDEAIAVGGPHRREADAAVAHHDGGDAVPCRRQQAAVPGGLTVVVAVDVDEARGDEQTVGRHLPVTAALDRSDLGDATGGDGDIRGASRCTGAVDHGAGTDDDVVVCHG